MSEAVGAGLYPAIIGGIASLVAQRRPCPAPASGTARRWVGRAAIRGIALWPAVSATLQSILFALMLWGLVAAPGFLSDSSSTVASIAHTQALSRGR